MTNETPRIYVACLASYNAGRLYGEWFDVDVDAEDLSAQVKDMLAESPEPGAEEYAIHDSENFYGFTVGEYSSLDEVCEAAKLIAKYGPIFGAAVGCFGSVEWATDAMTDRYCGAHDSAEDYAEEFYTDTCGGEVPKELQGCIDWERYAESLCLTEIRIGSEVHIFSQ